MKPTTITLNPGERVIAVVPDRCAGPGWSNAPTWVYIAGNDHTLRTECIQPEERSPGLHFLFSAGYAMTEALRAAVPVRMRKAKA